MTFLTAGEQQALISNKLATVSSQWYIKVKYWEWLKMSQPISKLLCS